MRTTMRKIGIRAAAVLLTFSGGVAVTGAAVLTGAGPASASCSWYSQNLDPGSEQIIHPESGYSGIMMRTGASTGCDPVYRVPWGNWVTLDCYVNGGETLHGVSTWSRVRYGNGGPLYQGWINDYYLSHGGSNYNCGG